MSFSTKPRLILCPDFAAYLQVLGNLTGVDVARLNIPVITGDTPQLKGFPPQIPSINFADWTGQSAPKLDNQEPIKSDSDLRICLALQEDRACVAVARYLCLATGKELRFSTGGPEWEVSILELAANPYLKSLTLILPSWRGKELDPGWLIRALNLMRSPEMQKRALNLSWGIITGHSEAVITQLAAKAVLQAEIMVAYQGAPSVIISNYDKETLNTPVERVNLVDSRASLQLFDQKWIDEGYSRHILKQPLQALIFKGHGRNYCALDGYLCGARSLAQDPDTPPQSCVLGMNCASSHFPQLDPRAYDTPVMLMDCCGTGNWASYVWKTGIPSLAYFAVAGAPGTVITEDGVTINGSIDYLDGLWALISAPTMGKATAHLNLARRKENPLPPNFLLGDPDIPAGSERWPDWSTMLSEPYPLPARLPGSALWLVSIPPHKTQFLRLRLPVLPQETNSVTFVWSLQDDIEVSNARFYQLEKEAELFLTLNRLPTSNSTLLVEHIPCPSLPEGLLQAAIDLPLILGSWLAPLEAARLPLMDAAQEMIKTAELMEKIAGEAVTFSFQELQAVLNRTQTAWIKAHQNAIQLILNFAPYSLWPASLWTTYNHQAEEVDRSCPHCGLAPTILRTCQTVPGGKLPRHALECLRCDLVEDLPVKANLPVLKMLVPATIRPGQFQIELEIDNSRGEKNFWGAGTILMDRSGHGVSSNPESFIVEIKSGKQFKTTVTLTLVDDPPISHQYRVRAVILLNGDWFWLSRTVVVYGRETLTTQPEK